VLETKYPGLNSFKYKKE
jgi:cystathionine gamma-lyase